MIVELTNKQGATMAISKHARDLLFYDMVVSRRTHLAPHPPLSEMAALWVEAAEDLDAPIKEFEKGAVTCIIKDYQLDEKAKILTLLIEISDKNAPNTTYHDHVERTSETFEKNENEGNGFSAHVMIHLEEQKKNTYMTAIEVIPTVTPSRIQSILNWTVRRICKERPELFTYVKPGGSKKKLPYVPHILLAGHPSAAFIRDLEEGRINGMKLISTEEKKPLGKKGYLKIEEYSAKVTVSKDIPEGERWKWLKKGAKMQKDRFPTARIFVQPESGGKSFHVDIDSDSGTLIGQAYTKSKRLSGFDGMLHSSSPDEIVPQFVEKAKAAILREVS